MTDSGQHVIVAANPKSGKASSRERVSQLRQAIIDSGFQCDVVHSLDTVRSRSHALQQSRVLRAVVSAGGDGTAGALANLLSAEIPILLFPLGTENLLAKHFGLAADLRQTCDVLKHGRPVAMDVGCANGKLFLVMLSCGFDAEVVRQMDAARTGHINRLSYTRPIISALSRYRFPQLPLTMDGSSQGQQFAAWTFVFNVPRYAAGLEFCPQADPVDGLLDVCTFQRSGIGFGIGYLLRLFLRNHQTMRGFHHERCTKLVIESPLSSNGKPITGIPYQIDGDPGGELPLEIQILPKRLTLLVADVAELA